MKTMLRALALLVLALGPTACVSGGSKGVPCVCGTPQGDLEGCHAQPCARGKRNPDNADCICGTLSLPR